MDNVLSEFITRTSAEPGLARDILENYNWSLQVALGKFNIMKGLADEDEIFSNKSDKKCTKIIKSFSHPLINTIPGNQISSKELSIQNSSKNNEKKFDTIVQKKLLRGISRATDNINLVSKIRNEFAYDFHNNKEKEYFQEKFSLDIPDYTFVLPDISIYSDDFKQFLEKDLIEKSTLISLKKAKRLNWWYDDLKIAQKLWPLATTGDGNCLLHAASLGMWGFHDRLLTLRKALHFFLINNDSSVSSFYRRWRWQCTLQNKEAGLILCEEEWTNEWQSLLKMASTEPRVRGYCAKTKNTELNGGKKEFSFEDEFQNHVYESLEEIHILVLAHILKRPIIVIADTMLKDVTGEPFAPIPFGGIYLPMKCNPKECNRDPLCLTYDAAHFSALVAMNKDFCDDETSSLPVAIPLVDSNGKLLPLQFIVEPFSDIDWSKNENEEKIYNQLQLTFKEKLNLLNSYLDIVLLSKDDNQTVQKLNLSTEKMSFKDTFNESISNSECNTIDLESSSNSSTNTKHSKFSINSLGSKFSTFKRTMSKRIKKKFTKLCEKGSFHSKKNGESLIKKTELCHNYKENNLCNFDYDSEENLVPKDCVLAVLIHTEKRPEYYEKMIKNYIYTASMRFLKDVKEKQQKLILTQEMNVSNEFITSINSSPNASEIELIKDDFLIECINIECVNFTKSSTNLLCNNCFINKKTELDLAEKQKLSF